MNAYYQRNNRTITVTNTRPYRGAMAGDKLIAFICAIVAALTSTIAIRIEKALLCTAGFILSVGVIGGMESGSISLLFGILICSAVALVEFLIFKSIFKRGETK